MVLNYGINVFYSRPIARLRGDTEFNNSDRIEGMRELKTYATSSSFVHSLYLYNGSIQYIYSTLDADLSTGSAPINSFSDSTAIALMLERDHTGPVYRTIPTNGGCPVISFPACKTQDSEGQVTSSLLVNISYDWLKNSLSTLLKMDNVTILSYNGNMVFGSGGLQEVPMLSIIDQYTREPTPSAYQVQRVNGEKYICFYTHVPKLNWYFLRIMPYNECLRDALVLRRRMVVMILCVAAAAMSCGLLVIRHFYGPVEKLMSSIPDHALQDAPLSTRLILDRAAEEMENYSRLQRMECLRQLLLYPSREANLQQMLDRNHIDLAADQPLLVLLTPDGTLSLEHQDALEDCTGEVVRLNSKNVLLLQSNVQDSAMIASAVSARTGFCAYDSAADLFAVSETYHHLQEVEALRVFLPESPILSGDVLIGRTEMPYPKKLESRVLSALRSGNHEKAMQILDEFIDTLVQGCRYTALRARFKQLYQAAAAILGDQAEERDGETSFEVVYPSCENIEQLKGIYRSLFERVSAYSRSKKKRQEALLIDEIKRYIQQNYMDQGLSLGSIAEAECLSVDHAGDLFRSQENISIAKYINQVRFDHARALLLESDLPVSEIARKVGFSNPQYFFTLFKATYTMTPSEYRRTARADPESPPPES